MAWCPKCDGNYQIVVSVEGSPYGVPVITERYSSEGKYIGYEESETYSTDIETHPRCSNCYSVFEFPNVTSKKEYFYAKRQQLIQRERNKPCPPSEIGDYIWGLLFLVGVGSAIVWGILQKLVGASISAPNPIVTAVVVVLGIVVVVRGIVNKIRSEMETKDYHFKKVRQKVDELQTMEYSDENYERLKHT